MNYNSYKDYLNDEENNLVVTNTYKEYEISLSYMPVDLFIYREIKSNDTSTYRELKASYGDNRYFLLKMSKNNEEILNQYVADYDKYVEMLAFEMNKIAYILTSDKDTIDLYDSYLERTYSMTNSNSILLIFNNSKINKVEWFEIVINGSKLGFGIQKFRFNQKDIKSIPELILN